MRLTVIATLEDAEASLLKDCTVIVLDVLRATTNMVTALEAGCTSIVLVRSPGEARSLRRSGTLLAGERECVRIEGFDLGNSPLEFTEARVAGSQLVMTTTNGTEALRLAGPAAATVLAGCLRNADACARAAIGFGRDIVLLCAGTKGRFSLEDGLGAGAIADRIARLAGHSPEADDMAATLRLAYLQAASRLENRLLASENGQRLLRLGFGEDVRFCSREDVSSVVPLLAGGELIAW